MIAGAHQVEGRVDLPEGLLDVRRHPKRSGMAVAARCLEKGRHGGAHGRARELRGIDRSEVLDAFSEQVAALTCLRIGERLNPAGGSDTGSVSALPTRNESPVLV